MWHHFILVFCCFTVAVTASERSPAKVRIHHERSTQAELIASVEALGKTHHLKLKRTSMPSVPLHELRQDDNGTVIIVEISGNEAKSYYEDEETGAFLFMNNENTLEGLISDSVALHYDNNEHTVTEVNEKTATPFCDVSHNEKMVDLPKYTESSRQAPLSYVVEVFAVVDSTLYNYKTSTYFMDYMRVYWKMVDRRFRTVIKASITIRLSKIFSSTSTACDSSLMDASDPNFAKLSTSKTQFAKYLSYQRAAGVAFDVGHLMTRRNLYELENGNRNTAYQGGVFAVGYPCYVNSTHAHNSGVSEDDGLWTGTLNTAHEIGHNLGACHDGEGTATGCSNSWGYIMSSVRNDARSFNFSSCSSDAMVKVYSQAHAGCLKTIDIPTSYPYPNYLAGTFDTLDKQCQRATSASNAMADQSWPASSQCFQLRCEYGSGSTKVLFISEYPALEGTPCSSGGSCKDGTCLY